MSLTFVTPGLIESATHNLAGIHSSLSEVAATVAGPTTGIASAAQDEVSVAVARMFGTVGEEFQALNTAARQFHAQFVNLLGSGTNAYLSAEVSNANAIFGAPAAVANGIETGMRGLSTSLGNAGAALTALESGGAPALVNSLNSFAATVAAPYQALMTNTATNLQSIGNTVMANPLPVLHQFVNNQVFYGQQIASAIQHLPTELSNLPANLQAAFHGLQNANPGAFLQGAVNNQIGYAQTVAHALTSAPGDFVTGLQGLPSAFHTGFQDIAAGNWTAGWNSIGTGLEHVFISGFAPIEIVGAPPLAPITVLGPLGDILPILSIPGQMAQNFTNLLPAASLPGVMAQNFTNFLQAVTGTTAFFDTTSLGIDFPLPLQLIFDGIGAPANAIGAFGTSATTFANALGAGNATGAVAALLDAPAVVTNGFLNGTQLFPLPPLPISILGTVTPAGAFLQLGGLISPVNPVLGDLGGLFPLGGTGVGGFIPGLLSIESQLAQAIVLPAPSLPSFVF